MKENYKQCTRCFKTKSKDNFRKMKNNKYCKMCDECRYKKSQYNRRYNILAEDRDSEENISSLLNDKYLNDINKKKEEKKDILNNQSYNCSHCKINNLTLGKKKNGVPYHTCERCRTIKKYKNIMKKYYNDIYEYNKNRNFEIQPNEVLEEGYMRCYYCSHARKLNDMCIKNHQYIHKCVDCDKEMKQKYGRYKLISK